jgi:N-acetylmuramoyl-L-alanine amidase
MKILIDNGHGVDTPGKRSPVWPDGSQLFEYEFNRDIANRVYRILKDQEQVDCELITPQINDVSLTERIRRVNAWCGNIECFLVSIHANAGGGTGWEIFTSPGVTKADHYATLIFNEAKLWLPKFRMRTDYSDGDPDKEAEFAIIMKTKCPAVLTENLFMDNFEDCKFLMSEEGREIISYIHVNGILKVAKT